jgi:hypothetical protein
MRSRRGLESMHALEQFATLSDLGCILMVHLYDNASGLMMHSVADRIDLWILHSDSKALTQELQRLARSEKNPDSKARYERQLEVQRLGITERENRPS